MKRLIASALLLASTCGALSGATFGVLTYHVQTGGQPVWESYVFSTTSIELISEIRDRIAHNWPVMPLVRIAPGSDGINRNLVARGSPLWNWHVVDVLDLDLIEIQVVGPKPYRETPLSVIDADVEGFIASVGDVIAPQFAAQIFEIDPDDPGHLFNVSSRGVLGSGDRVLITGFIVQGTTPRLVLVRALGPKLADLGVTGAAVDPNLTLFRGTIAIDRNDDWETRPTHELIPPGLEPLDPKDAAIVVILEPGAYTVHAASPDEGIGVVDVFDLTAMK